MKWQGILRLAACFSVLATAAAEPPPYVWLEGEKPASANFQFTPQTHAPQVFSAGESLFHAVPKEELGKVPAEGLLLAYDFTATADGEYQFWARVGFEWVRARMAWRVDGGEWRTYAETELTTSLMKVAVWQELGWGKCGAVRLTKGPHRLDVRFTQPPGNDRFLFGLDCLAFVQAEFVPEGRLKPGETYTAEADRAAAAHVFTFPPGKPQDAAVRVELPLSGPWQVARYDDLNMDAEPYAPVRELPASYPWRWMGISAPGDAWKQRPELPFAHRLVYQTRVRIPRELAGRSFVLHFAGTCYIVSVFINGQFCDSRQSVLVPWDCDITRLVKPGQNNLVQVAIKSGYYCLDLPPDKSGQKPSIHAGRNIPEGFHRHRRWADAVHPSSKGEGDGLQVGLVNPVSLVAAGPAYTSDVFVRTSVARKRLDATVELTNASSRETEVEVRCEAVHDRTGTVEKSFAPVQVKVAAGGKATVEIAGDWPDAKLWWPSEHVNDLPDCYRLRTTLLAGGAPLDRREDLFGFREITIQGRHFLLNGVRWRFYNWVDVPDRKSIKGSTDWFQRYHAQNDGFHRFSHDHSSIFGCREKAIDVLDRLGVPSRCSMCIDGMFITQELLNPLTWQNWERHVQQVVKAYRNHPSIMHWSVGNEVMLVNAHNVRRKDYVELEKKMLRLLQVAKELDPTRDSYEDGAGDLGGLGSINCVHYSWQWYDDVPRQLYQYPTGPAFQARPGERSETYLWDGNRPLIGGEEFYYANRPFNVAWIGGPDVYRSPERSHLAASRYVRMALEGARWQDAAGMCPWTEVLPGAEKALARRAVFVREHNQCFAPGATLTRTLKVFNDTRRPESLTLRWRVAFGGKDAASGEKSYTLAAGMNQEDTISAKLPDAKTRADGELRLELFSGDKRVFDDSRPLSVLPMPEKPPALAQGALAVFDPQGNLSKWLQTRKVPFTQATSPVSAADVLLIGPGALKAENVSAWAEAVREAVLAGKTVIALEQATPLEKKLLPVSGIEIGAPQKRRVTMGEFLQQGGRFGSICHPVALSHPVFRGLKPGDFFTWAGGETNYRLSYAAPSGGAVSLVQAGPELSLAPMIEAPVGAGACLLSQLLIGEKLEVEPVAGVLMHNLLTWAAERAARKPAPASVCTGGDTEWQTWLEALGLDFRPAASPAEALAGGPHVAILRADAKTLGWLRDNAAAVRAFANKGGWLVLCGLTQDGLEAFNALTGVRHRIRPFRREAVRVLDDMDPLVMGITDRDLSQRGYDMIAPWMQLFRTSEQVFSEVVDAAPDIASFADGPPRQVTDGLRNVDFWHYVLYLPSDGSQTVEFRFDRPEALAAMRLWTSGAYYWAKDIQVTLDGDEASAIRHTLKPNAESQEIPFEPRTVKTVTLKVLNYQGTATKDLVTVDEVSLIRQLSPDMSGKVAALTTPAGLVKYPLGSGGIVLNQLQWRETPPAEPPRNVDARKLAQIADENAQKKRAITSALLRNLGAAFRPVVTHEAAKRGKKG